MTKKKILFIEDDGLTREAYKEHFSNQYECIFALSGKEGIQKSIDESPELILLDIMLPGGANGFDVLRELKFRDETKFVPVVVLTNLADQHDSAIASGAIACLIKADTHMSEIEKLINETIGK